MRAEIFPWILVILLAAAEALASVPGIIQSSVFDVCPKGLILKEQSQQPKTATTPLDCIRTCSLVSDCTGVNLCLDDLSPRVTCTLTKEITINKCSDLRSEASTLCYHARKSPFVPNYHLRVDTSGVTTPISSYTHVVTADGPSYFVTAPSASSNQMTTADGLLNQGNTPEEPLNEGTAAIANGQLSQETTADGQFNQVTIADGQFNQVTTADGQFNQVTTADGQFNQLTTADGQFNQVTTADGQLSERTTTNGILNQGTTADGLLNQVSTTTYMSLSQVNATEVLSAEMTTVESEVTVTPNPCENGGTFDGENCNCTVEYSGTFCERRIRDCTESYEKGHQSSILNGAYYIQPITAPEPFMVRCAFEYGGITYPFWRTNLSNFNVNWTQCKEGIGDDLKANNESKNFFIGLENLFHLLKQAEFQLHIFVMYDGGKGGLYYDNFTIGPESSSYVVSYKGYTENKDYDWNVLDGFSASSPLYFRAEGKGNDPNGCFDLNKIPGWYDVFCFGYSMFSNGTFSWPFSDGNKSLSSMEFNLKRQSPYYFQN